ncbi:MAG: DUF3775 domain-containing protein [Roseiarcus sp.]
MLRTLNKDQAHFIALLAKTARTERDNLLGNVAEKDLGEIKPVRGEHNPTASLGFDPLPASSESLKALRKAIASLAPAARAELFALMRVGQGDLAAQKWHRGISEAERVGEAATSAALLDDADLHDHLVKGLYETEAG